MGYFRKHTQLIGTVLGLVVLAIGVVGVGAGLDRLGLITALIVLGIILGLTAHGHKRVGDTYRIVANEQKQRARLTQDEKAKEVALQDALARRTTSAVEETLNRQAAVLHSRLVDRIDIAEATLRSVGRYVSESSGRLGDQASRVEDQATRVEDQVEALREAADTWEVQSHRIAQSITEMGDRTSKETEGILQELIRHHHEAVTELDALLQLHRRHPFEGAVPLMWGWALSPRALLQVVDLASQETCRTVVECGSGTSSLFIAKALKAHGGRLIALEHLEDVRDAVVATLEDHGVADVVDIRLADLVEVELEGATYPWYDTSAIKDIEAIDLLLVDGPPGGAGSHARYPAFPLLRDLLSPGAAVLLDDYDRDDERTIVRQWVSDPRLQRERSITRATALLRWDPSSLSADQSVSPGADD